MVNGQAKVNAYQNNSFENNNMAINNGQKKRNLKTSQDAFRNGGERPLDAMTSDNETNVIFA